MIEYIKAILNWMGAVTQPLRKLKYGEDGKYIHILLGVFIIGMAILTPHANFVGLVILSAMWGISIELIQRGFGGGNTFKQSAFDAMWVVVGGTAFAYALLLGGYINLYWGA